MAVIEIEIVGKDSFSGVLGNFGSIITGIESAIHLAAEAFNAIAAPIAKFGQESILAAARVQELEIINRILGENAGIPYLAIEQEAAAVRKMGIEAAVSQEVIAQFIKANLDLSLASDIARVAQDAAVISGLNSTEVTSRIIDGIVTLNPLILREAGIIVDLRQAYEDWADANGTTVKEMTTAQKQTIALNEVLEAGVGIAGAYAAAMEEPGKVLRSFPRYFDDIMVAVGEPFQDAFGTVVFELADLAKWIGVAVSEGGFLRPLLDDMAKGAEKLALGFVSVSNAAQTFVEYLGGEIGMRRLLYDVGLSIRELGLTDLADALFRVSSLVGDNTSLWDAFKLVLDDVASGDGPLAKIATIFQDFITIGETGGWGAAISRLFDDVMNAINIPEKIQYLINLISPAIEKADWTGVTKAITGVIETVLNSLYETVGDVDWAPMGKAIVGAIGEAIAGVFGSTSWDDFAGDVGRGFEGIGAAIIDGIKGGIESRWENLKSILSFGFDDVIRFVKDILGIASPSTVFADIGRELVMGLISGWTNTFGLLLSVIRNSIGSIIDLFTSSGINVGVQGDSSSLLGGSTGTLGGRSTDGTGGTTVNQYFAGATINVGSWDQIAYDCLYPNPFVSATSGQLGGTVKLR